MKELVFPKLLADQIECRVGQTNDKGFSLLLYKTARTDADLLDQVVGCYNWQKRYYECRGLVICSIGIYFAERNEWVWKDDTGSAGTIEEEKSICSDAQKRSAFCWGIGRELYTAPFIWVSNDNGFKKTDKFDVKEIDYNEKGVISKLVIVETKTRKVAYSYGSTEKVSKIAEKTPNIANGKTLTDEIWEIINTFAEERQKKVFAFITKKFGALSIKDLTAEQQTELLTELKRSVK